MSAILAVNLITIAMCLVGIGAAVQVYLQGRENDRMWADTEARLANFAARIDALDD